MSTSQDWAEQLRAQSVERLEAVSRLQDELQHLTGSAASSSNEVRATVSPAGALLDLRLHDVALEQPADQLARLILATVQEAAADAGRKLRAVVGDALPAADLDALVSGQVAPSTRARVQDELAAQREARTGREDRA